jgi:FkbM family methyltransferase
MRTFEFASAHVPRRQKERDELSWRRLRFLRGRQATVKNQFGQPLLVRLESLGDLYAAFGRKAERGIVEVLGNLPAGGVVVDIGAHIGGFSLIAARAVGPTGHVFSIEPVSANTRLLEKNARLNNITWITPIEAAVGRKGGSIELLVSDADTMLATTRQSWANILHGERAPALLKRSQVNLITVDGFVREYALSHIALMKIDVEAAEMDVLAGAAETLARGAIEQLIIEIHGPTVKWMDVVAILRGYGYDTSDIGPGEMHATLRRAAGRPSGTAGAFRKPVTVGLIGCGAVSDKFYSKALATLAYEGLAETVALVDPDPERRSAVSVSLAAARQYSDIESMLKEATPDLAIIAAPHTLHAELSVACLRHGAHVLCEKPMAMTTSECDRMIQTAAEAGLLLAAGHFRRFYPSCALIKTILDAGILGPVRSFDFAEGYHYSWPARTASFLRRDQAGGGVFVDIGSHAIDLILWWLGEPRELVYEDDAMGGLEANCHLRFRMIGGAEGLLRLSRDWPLANRYVIRCEKGWLEYSCDVMDRIRWGLYESDYSLNTQLRTLMPADAARSTDAHQGVSNQLETYFTAQLRNVVAAIAGREPLRMSGAEARKTVAAIEACYRARGMLHMPWLDEAERRRALEMAHAG